MSENGQKGDALEVGKKMIGILEKQRKIASETRKLNSKSEKTTIDDNRMILTNAKIFSKPLGRKKVKSVVAKIRTTWNKEQIIKEIKNTLSSRGVIDPRSKIYAAAKYHFGSWKNALEQAGFKDLLQRPRWSREEIIYKIRQYHYQGIDISYGSMRVNNEALLTAGSRHFDGGWNEALRSAGFDPDVIKKIKNEKECYSQDFLRVMLNHESTLCAFPDCLNKQTKGVWGNTWHVCLYHAGKMQNAFRARKKRRQQIIQSEGLT